ncbi:protein kinase [Pseudogracilibacillus sp. SE30717A]|uniref:protein kinase domain-containing protein n=1 Tax=Pseudogracilibacillus sp. SE30717A TaxID=3098293 RepID=UPI00300E260B
MAKNLQKKASFVVRTGTIIQGKWNNKKYTVVRKIGAGMIGTVYLCRMQNRLVALKMSDQAISMTAEVNVLKSLNKVQDNRLGPFLLDVDDWEYQENRTYSFYVMEYINGISMEEFVRKNGYEWIGVFLIQMLEQLEKLHQTGWIFGDLKNDNILITSSPPLVRFVDVGGTTKSGRSIKEYSEFYDRAYWHLGAREAEPSYDLFAMVMVVLAIFYPKKFKRNHDSKTLLISRLNAIPELRLYNRSLQKAVFGKYASAKEMKDELMHLMIKQQSKAKRKENKPSYLVEAFLIIVASGTYYFVLQMLL